MSSKVPEWHKLLIALGLAAGLVGMIFHTWLIWDAASHTGVYLPKYVVQIDYNHFGEGAFEQYFLMPFMTLLSASGLYLFFQSYVR